MWKCFFVGYFLTQILVYHVNSRRFDIDEFENLSESLEVPVKSRPKSSRFSILGKVEDPVLNFINKLLTTAYSSSKIALTRARSRSEKRKELEDEIETFLEKIPTFPVPILDDITNAINHDHDMDR